MAVGDSVLFTIRGEFGETDATVTAVEPTIRDGSIVVSPEVELTGSGQLAPGVIFRFFRQESDGSFTPQFTVTEFAGNSFTPDIQFTDDLDREQFTIGVTAAQIDDTPPTSVPSGNTLSVSLNRGPTDPDPIPPAEGQNQFNVVLPSLPLIENDPRILAALTIPQIPSIKSAVLETVPSLGEIRGEVDTAINGSLQQTEDRVIDEIQNEVGDIDVPDAPDVPSVDQIVTDVERTVLDPIVADIDSAVSDITSQVDQTVGNIESTVDSQITSLTDDVSSVADDIGGLIDDVGELDQKVSDIQTVGEDTIETAVEDAVGAVEPEFNDSGLFSDPVGFAVGFVQEASDELVDPEVSQDLQDTLDNR
jgi:hypothetical protein